MSQRQIIPATEYQNIFLNDRPLMDARAPIEFDKGAFPCSTNLPLMTDSERQKVGTCYKEQGPQAALELGHQLVNGKTKQQRVDAWLAFFNANPDANLYCFRGGLRSQITQGWIKEAGLDVAYIEGGYKAMRQYLIESIDAAAVSQPILILSGITGSGKTDFLKLRHEAIDLEGIAHHRGSSFGKYHEPQPSQINFENKLAVSLLKHQQRQTNCLLLEDESFLIGRNAIPKPFYHSMQQASLVVLEEPHQDRLQRLLNEYVHIMHDGFIERLGEEQGFNAFYDYLTQSLIGVKKRLGNQRLAELQAHVDHAIKVQQQTGDTQAHLAWIESLLVDYYDPMYNYQLDNKADRVLFRGNHQAMHQWLDEYQPR